MDDFNLSCLSEAKNEYTARLVNMLTPHITEGIQSIFKEAWNLCDENEEQSKYLVTFQNFLARIPKWNQAIIEEETVRIMEKSGCDYLEDLVTCVHITQLKVLTSIRVGMKQKKLELDVPRIGDFIHRVYIAVARKLYKNVYLFERGIPALQIQRNLRELELIIRESILSTVRDSIPTDHILRAYMDPSTEIEEEVEEREYVEQIPEVKEEPVKEQVVEQKEEKVEEPVKEQEGGIVITKEESVSVPESTQEEKTEKEDVPAINLDISGYTSVEDVSTNHNEKLSKNDNQPKLEVDTQPKEQTLQFNDVDQVLNMRTNKEEKVEAPKTVERLEEIGMERDQQRRMEEAEEAEEDNLKILDDADDFKLDIETLEEPKPEKQPDPPIELEVDDLPF